MRNSPRLYRILLIGVFCFLVAACANRPGESPSSSNSTPNVTGKRGGTVVYRLTSAPTTFNYPVAADEASALMAFFLLNGRLIEFDHRERKYAASLAESWKLAPDGLTVEVLLREGIKFSDGQSITAEDFVFALKAIYDPRTNSPVFRDGLMVGGKEIQAKAVDARNLQLVFPEKVASIENYLVNLAVLPSHALKAAFDAGKFAETWRIDAEPRSVVTSGAFAVEATTPGERVALVRNPHFWKKDADGVQLPYIERLVLEVIPDPNNAVVKLEQNTLDIADRIRPGDFDAIGSKPGAAKAIDLGPGLATDYVWFNLNPRTAAGDSLDTKPKYSWFNNRQFRQAISFAIDRSSIASSALRGRATPLYGFVSPANTTWADPNIPKTEYNLDKSRQLLRDAGFSLRSESELVDRSGNPVEFSLLVPAENEPRKLMAAVIQEDLARLGIKMTVVPVENQAIAERWSKTFDYDAVLLGLGLSDFDPSSYANFLLSSAGNHQWHPRQKKASTDWEARVDTLFTEQSRETDRQKRLTIFSEIQKVLAEEFPIVPVVSRHVLSAASNRLGNHSPSIIMPGSLWNAEELFIKQ